MARSSKKRYLNPGFPMGSPILIELEQEAERLGLSINDVLQLWANEHHEMRLYLQQHGITGGWRGLIQPSLPVQPLITGVLPQVIERQKTEEEEQLERKTQKANRFRDI